MRPLPSASARVESNPRDPMFPAAVNDWSSYATALARRRDARPARARDAARADEPFQGCAPLAYRRSATREVGWGDSNSWVTFRRPQSERAEGEPCFSLSCAERVICLQKKVGCKPKSSSRIGLAGALHFSLNSRPQRDSKERP